MTRLPEITTKLLARRTIPNVANLEALLLSGDPDPVFLLQTVAERGRPRVQQLALLARDAASLRLLAVATLERLDRSRLPAKGGTGGIVLACEPLSDGDALRAVWLDDEQGPYFALVAGSPDQGRCLVVDGRYGEELAKLLCKGAAVLAPMPRTALH